MKKDRMSAAEWREHELAAMSEKEFQDTHVIPLARTFGWWIYHTHISRRSEAGFPDLVGLKGPRCFVAELKTEKGKLTLPQEPVLERFRQIPGIEVYLWRPSDLPEIKRLLGA